ncbi:hypothetical protein [Paraburkholderia terrae]|uniref:hypothetical protein n=1 Tax=Paraburkholderia terrae TaxID=311230 RepID=UPI0012E030D6|nr:hypothetical protein [Paraburkholderia terrae]
MRSDASRTVIAPQRELLRRRVVIRLRLRHTVRVVRRLCRYVVLVCLLLRIARALLQLVINGTDDLHANLHHALLDRHVIRHLLRIEGVCN